MNLPVGQVESLRFKAGQMLESLQALHRAVDGSGLPRMPAWPDILSKYSLILSQSHSLTTALAAHPWGDIALHPHAPLSDLQLDNDLIPLLRIQQTTDVLRIESTTVRRLAECMATRGAIATDPSVPAPASRQRVTHDDVLAECAEIRDAHDRRVERAVRAVLMLKDRFDWKQRVQVDEPEPEELDWDPRMPHQPAHSEMADEEGQSSDEEEVVEGELAGDDGQTPMGTPADAEMTPAEGLR